MGMYDNGYWLDGHDFSPENWKEYFAYSYISYFIKWNLSQVKHVKVKLTFSAKPVALNIVIIHIHAFHISLDEIAISLWQDKVKLTFSGKLAALDIVVLKWLTLMV